MTNEELRQKYRFLKLVAQEGARFTRSTQAVES